MRLLSGFVCVILLACIPQAQHSNLKHDAARYVFSADAWNWEDLTVEEFEEVHIPSNGWGTADDFLPLSHPATRRMDHLLGRIHDRIREHYPEQLQHVPRPRARIYQADSVDAYVTSVPVCYDIPVSLNPDTARQGPGTVVERITLDHNGQLSAAGDDDLCVKRSLSPDEARKYFDWISDNIRRAGTEAGTSGDFCELRIVPDDEGFTVVPGAACERSTDLASVSQARSFVIWKTQPYIVLYSGILQHVDAEIKLITTLAHELAHYYRSHLTAFAGDYDYFYKLDARGNPAHKPQRDPSLQERGREILAAAELVQSYLEEEPLQEYPSELFYPVWELASRACPVSSKERCPEVCASFVAFLHDDAVNDAFGAWPYDSMPDEGHELYQRYEEQLSACAGQLSLTEGPTAGPRLSLRDMHEAFQAADFMKTLEAMDLADLSHFKGWTLEQVIATLDSGLNSAKLRAQKILEQANADGIGYYTWEQEADEQQMETVSLLGLDPAQLVAWDLEFYKNLEGGSDEHQGLDMTRCEELLNKGWKENGKPVLVPVANYFDQHHSDCFRIFTSSREIAAHRLDQQQAEVPISFLSDQEWQKLQTSLEDGF